VKIYLDSSFLFSMYTPDVHFASASALLSRTSGDLVLSSLTELELSNALELRIFRKELNRVQVDRAHAAFESDVQRGVLRVFELAPDAFSRTKDLIMKNTGSVGCRTADILHVAAAIEAAADGIFTFDLRQKELARRLKLRTN
jgi:predicted nucleic acid-binding protein